MFIKPTTVTRLGRSVWTINKSSQTHKMSPTPSPSSPQKLQIKETPKIRKPFLTVSVDGNISSGKSTLVSTLVDLCPKDFNFCVETVPEPLEKWTNMQGHNLLQLLYEDTTKNNFIFQHYVQLTRLMDTIRKPGDDHVVNGYKGKIRIMERSIQNNRYCFSELARRKGTLHEAEFAVIAEWYKWLEEHTELPLDLIIYLRTDPSVVFERMKTRGRSEESAVPLDYLSDLHETYEDWLIRGKIEEEGNIGTKTDTSTLNNKKYKIIVVDANKSKVEVAEQCRQLIHEYLSTVTAIDQMEVNLNSESVGKSIDSI